MYLVQMIAADWAGLEGIVFHAPIAEPFVLACAKFASLQERCCGHDDALRFLAAQRYAWGVSDGNQAGAASACQQAAAGNVPVAGEFKAREEGEQGMGVRTVFALMALFWLATAQAQGIDRDRDNDGVWDADRGGIDRDRDNDGVWDADVGGTDRDLDNDGVWDADMGGIDRDRDNDGTWDHDAGGIDRDLDNDGIWDHDAGGIDRDLDNDGIWDYER